MTRRALAAALFSAVALLALVAGSGVPWEIDREDAALIRLSWRAVGERVEECREPSAEEQAALPPHMRQPRICEARLAPFRLTVSVDGSEVFNGIIRPAGVRDDRPAYVFHEFRVAPGAHDLDVRFATQVRGDAAPHPPQVLVQKLDLAPREIALVTRSESGLALARR